MSQRKRRRHLVEAGLVKPPPGPGQHAGHARGLVDTLTEKGAQELLAALEDVQIARPLRRALAERLYGREPVTNARLAQVAEAVADTFTLEMYGGRTFSELVDEDKETALYDLICDLGHLAHREGLILSDSDFDDVLARAFRHYRAETKFSWNEEHR